jgi:hypothetical protein
MWSESEPQQLNCYWDNAEHTFANQTIHKLDKVYKEKWELTVLQKLWHF